MAMSAIAVAEIAVALAKVFLLPLHLEVFSGALEVSSYATKSISKCTKIYCRVHPRVSWDASRRIPECTATARRFPRCG